MKSLIRVLALSALLVVQTLPSHAQDTPKRSVTEIAPDVYITDEGAIITDPINTKAALWIRSEVAKLTDKPITHLIYSHSHADHASGGAVLAKGATVIAQSNAPESIDGVEPTLRFDETYEFTQGKKSFELTWLGPGHGEDLIAVVVRPSNVAFITDVAAPKRLPWRNMGGANIDDWIEQVRKVESLDFDIFAPAHGSVGVKSDATDVRGYLEKLKTEVLSGLEGGKTVDELKTDVTMSDYVDWGQYEAWRVTNVLRRLHHSVSGTTPHVLAADVLVGCLIHGCVIYLIYISWQIPGVTAVTD